IDWHCLGRYVARFVKYPFAGTTRYIRKGCGSAVAVITYERDLLCLPGIRMGGVRSFQWFRIIDVYIIYFRIGSCYLIPVYGIIAPVVGSVIPTCKFEVDFIDVIGSSVLKQA